MPLDTSIALQTRGIQLDDPVKQYSNALAIENAQRQNRLASQAEADDIAVRNALAASGGDYAKASTNLLGLGLYKPAMAIQESVDKRAKAKADLTKAEADAAGKKLEIYGNAMSGILADPTPENAQSVVTFLQSQGIKPHAPMPSIMNQQAFMNWVRAGAAQSAHGLQVLKAYQPDVVMTDLGGTVTPTNKNPLAGAIGPMPGSPAMPKTATIADNIRSANEPFKPDGTPNVPVQQFQLTKSATSAPRVTVDNRAEGTYATKVAGGAADRDEGQHVAAVAAPDNIKKMNDTIKLLRTGQPITGMAADILKNVERAKAQFLNDKAAGKIATDTEVLDAMLGSDVFPMIHALGIGARGMDTPAEREFLRKVMSGTIDMNKDTLLKMTEIRRDVAKRVAEKYNARVDSGELDRFFQYSGAPKRKVAIPDDVERSLPNVNGRPHANKTDAEIKKELGL